jgi:deoxyribonuclease V
MYQKWPDTIKQAKSIQEKLLKEINLKNLVKNPRYICGCDVSYAPQKTSTKVKAACAIYSYPYIKEIEISTFQTTCKSLFPYIPGYLSFRETPFILKAIEKIKSSVDVFVVDGQGLLHPRECGMAVHLGIILKKPVIGCAKNRLYGHEEDVDRMKGDYSFITSKNGKIIGAKVRTRTDVRPLYVSQGWGVSLKKSIEIIVHCCTKYRFPEVLRAAHRASQF